MDIVLIIFVFAMIAIGGAYWLAKPQFIEIPEEERYVIYQFGRFKRIVGPGPVLIWGNSETVERKVNVRNEPKDIVVNGLYVYDIPFGYKLNFWCRFDPDTLWRAEPERGAELVQFEEHERHQQIAVKVRDALVNSVVKVQDAQPSTPNSLLGKILLIAPGLDGYNMIMQYVKDELLQTLPTIGVQLDNRQPITSTKLYLDPGVVGILNRDRIVEQIGDNFDDLSSIEKVQTISAIEGLTIPPVQNISTTDLANSNYKAEFDVRQGETSADVRTRFRQGKTESQPTVVEAETPTVEEAVEEGVASAGDTQTQPDASTDKLTADKLTTDDLAVLKRVA